MRYFFLRLHIHRSTMSSRETGVSYFKNMTTTSPIEMPYSGHIKFIVWETTPVGHTRAILITVEVYKFGESCWRKASKRKLKKPGHLAAFLLVNDFMKNPSICHPGGQWKLQIHLSEPLSIPPSSFCKPEDLV